MIPAYIDLVNESSANTAETTPQLNGFRHIGETPWVVILAELVASISELAFGLKRRLICDSVMAPSSNMA